MKNSTKRLLCCLLLVTLSTVTLAGDSFTARIPAAIAAGNYAEAQVLIAEAVKIGVIITVAAESYKKSIRQAEERASADPKSGLANQPSPERKPAPDWVPLPHPSEPERDRQGKRGRIYVSYTKFNKSTKRYYSGRTSMVIHMDQSYQTQAEAAVSP